MAIIYPPMRPSLATWVSGKVYGPPNVPGNGTRTLGIQQNYYIPIVVPNTVTIAKIGAEITTAGTTAVVRYGIYTDNNGMPDQLVANSGTGALSVTGTGVLENTYGSPPSLGPGLYWLCISQNSAAVACAMRSTNSQYNGMFVGALSGSAGTAVTQGNLSGLSTAVGAGDAGALTQTAKAPTGTLALCPLPYVIIT